MSVMTQPRREVDPIKDLPAISLETLSAHAERMTRVDRKYLLPSSLIPRLVDSVADDAVALEIDGIRSFGYASTYFDTHDFRSFHEGGRSRRRRFKVRTRAYLDSGGQWVEVKTRGPRGTTVKTRAPLSGSTDALVGPDADFVTATLRLHGIADVVASELRPTLHVSYTRSTLAFLSDGARTTIDTALAWRTSMLPMAQWTESRLGDHPIGANGLAVLETKAGSTPTSVDRALWRLGHRPVRMSKYGAGLATLRPDLPHLKWHRTLTNPLLALAS